MNKASILTFVLMIALFAVSASADLTVSDVQFGDESQERDQNVTKTITVTNTDTVNTVTISGIVFTGINGADVSQYKFTVNSATGLTVTNGVLSGTLNANATATVTLQTYVPKKFSAVDTDLLAKAFEIAKISFTGNTVTVAGGKVTMQAKNKLVVDDMTVTVNGESQSVSNNEKVDNLKPGDKLELEVVAKNQFSDRSDVDTAVEDVIVSVLSSNLDQLDVDDEEDVGTLSAKSDDSARFTFDVEDDTDDSTYTLTVKVSGLDENGAKHGEKVTVRLKVERETHEIAFKKVQVVPSEVECDGARTAIVDATVSNIGQRDEDEIVVEAGVPSLKFSQKITGLKLNDGKSKTVQFPIDVPDDAKAGTHRVDLTSYFANTMKSNTKSVSFDVVECEVEEEPEPTIVQPPVVVTPPPATTTTAPKAKVTPVDSFTNSMLYIYLLAGLSGVLVLLLFVMVVALVSRRRRDED